MKLAIAYLTKDRVELTKQTFGRVADSGVDIFWCDGSSTMEVLELFGACFVPTTTLHENVRGGADAAIIYALTTMLESSAEYTHIGLCENDVFLDPNWLTYVKGAIALAEDEGLKVGAVSARSYEDRILIQRDGYAVMHNLGAGHVVFTREAAEIVLAYYRTGWWTDNRSIFAQLSGVDIGRFGAFRGNQQWTTADWHFDCILAQYGLASIAVTPSAATMIGQEPSLEEQGLKIVTESVEARRDEVAFALFVERTSDIRNGYWKPQAITRIHRAAGANGPLYFPHQLSINRNQHWRLKWSQGFGPFSWRSVDDEATFRTVLYGPCTFLVSGGEKGAKIKITTDSGFEINPDLPPVDQSGIVQLSVPGNVIYREITVTGGAGVVFYGIQTLESQPVTDHKFDYHSLPPV